MESARIARCSYRAVTVVIDLLEHSKYADICKEICLRFKQLTVGSFELTYSLPEHPNCLLQSDMDVHLMLMCLSMLKSSFVDISVKDLVSSNNEDGNIAAPNPPPQCRAVCNYAASDQTPHTHSHAVSNHEACDHDATNHATTDHLASDQAASNHATPGAPNHAAPGAPNRTLSDDATSNLAASNNAPSSDATSNHAASHRAAFIDVISNHDVSNHEVSNHVAFDDVISNHASCDDVISNHLASSSCMLDSISRFQESDTHLSQGWKEYIDHVGQKFEAGATGFRTKLCMYAFAMGFRFAYVKNDKDRVIAECFKKISDGCNWRVYASVCRLNGFFYIKTLNNVHTCTGVNREEKSKMMNAKIVSSILVDQIRGKPSIKPVDIVKDFKQNYGLDIPYHTAWYAKEMAKSEVHGDESSSYSRLVGYNNVLMSSNPGSHCVLDCDPKTSRFRRLFICYGACIEGFQWCRPLLFVDVTVLESKHEGQLIGATGKNGNQGSFPFAFAIVDSENEENWSWFFENLAKILTPQGRTVTFVSDQNKGLVEAVSNIFPTSPHAFCLQNLKQNLLSKFPSTYGKFLRDRIVDLFSKCAHAPTKAAFEVNLRNLKHEGGAPVMTFLEDLPKEKWSYAYFKGNQYGETCNNVSETFNSWILELCGLPIFHMVDGIRIKLMRMMAELSHEAEQWSSVLCPEMEKTLNEILMLGRNWNVSRSTASVYEVHADYSVMVDLHNRLCTCHEWQIKGFPCVHALVAVQKHSGNIYEYIDDLFKSSYFRSSYGFRISPVPDTKNVMDEGSEDVIMPPPTKKRRGRPRTKMPKSLGEV
ncbi:hypothetical protein FF1_009174 [Malus domestica]